MSYKYRFGSTPDHVDSSNSDSTPTTEMAGSISDSDSTSVKPKKRLDMGKMSDSIRADEGRSQHGDQAANKRWGKSSAAYMIQMAEDDSAEAAKGPAKTRAMVKDMQTKAEKTGKNQYYVDGLAITPQKKKK